MHIFDLIVTVNEQGQIAALEWRNHQQEILYGALWSSRIDTVPEGFPPLNESQDSGDFWWEDRHFFYERLRIRAATYYFLKLQEHHEQLYKAALDSFQDGVQIYDKNANVLYFNRASRVLSGFSDSSAVEGKYLMDLYRNIPEDFSTTLTALRTRKPVVARFASYNTIEGKPIIALNSGYPILSQDGHLLGAVVHEQNMTILQEKMKQLEKLKAAMTKQMAGDLHRQQTKYSFSDIIGHSEPLQHAVEIAERVSIRDGNVLLVGETGTGKEIFAQSIHYSSPRKQGKFVSINCAAVPETLIESILFGTTKGAFTGSTEKAGLFEETANGTLFLDELNSMSLSMQSKILRVLQEGTFRRIGGSQDIHTNARIISACNEDPYALVEQNKMRRDLFYRVGTILINIPPLRERPEDIEELAYYHLKQCEAHYALAVQKIDLRTLEILQRYSWPGNVRELNHAIDYAMNFCAGEVLLPEYLPQHLLNMEQSFDTRGMAVQPKEDSVTLSRLQDLMDAYEDELIRKALRICQGNISKTAALLDIKRQSLQYRIHKYNIIL